MKKALVILLALTMVMSMFAMVPVSAADEELAVGQVAADYKPEGTAVNNAAEFAAMDPAGTYYLAADITIDETYYDSFTGTLDGNGKTITTSTTIFENLDGTVKNLTISGSITVDASLLGTVGANVTGSLAHYAAVNANANIDNVCNMAPLTSYACGMGGIVGRGANSSEFVLTITNCANYGNITTNCNTDSNYDSGGIIATFRGVKANAESQLIIDNCVNYGTINADGRPGGIAGNVDTSATITNCTNNGPVQAIFNYCGGIAGRFGADDYTAATFYVENCVNNADLYQSCTKLAVNGTNPYKTAQVGGMVGYQGNVKQLYYKNCTNNGNISAECKLSAANFGGMVGANKADAEIIIFENCVNNGDINGEDMVGKNVQAGGIAGIAYASKKLEYINCVNNGNIVTSVASGTTYARSAGLCANSQLKNGGESGYMKVTGCFNTGDIKVDNTGSNPANANNNAGGLFAYVLGGVGYGTQIEFCGNTGNVTGLSMVSGLIGYINSDHSIIRYNFIAGKLTSTLPAVSLKQGENADGGYNYQSVFTFNYNDKDYYFVIPYNADKLTISGTTVTPVYTIQAEGSGHSSQVEVADGTAYTGISGKWCYWKVGADQYWFKATANGTVTIDGTKAYVDGVEQAVAFAGIKVFDTDIRTRALVWSNKNQFEIKDEQNFIETGAAGVDYAMGDLNTFGINYINYDANNKYAKEQFASGEVAYALNEMIGETKFYQNLNPDLFVVDAYPTTDSAHAKVVKVAGVIGNQLFDMNNDEGSPATGDAMIYVVVALAVSTISLAAVAVVKKIKEN